jgi:hypothetical protein
VYDKGMRHVPSLVGSAYLVVYAQAPPKIKGLDLARASDSPEAETAASDSL